MEKDKSMNEVIARIPMNGESFRDQVSAMKTALEAFVESYTGSASFGQIAENVPGFIGGILGFGHGGFHCWYYQNLTAVACAAMCELVQEGVFNVVPTIVQDYEEDKHRPLLPVQSQLRPSGRPVWIPCRVQNASWSMDRKINLAQGIFVSEEELGRCLHFEATMPLVQEAIELLNGCQRDIFFSEAANRRGTTDDYDLFYTIGSHTIEVMDKDEFRAHLMRTAKVNPHIIPEAEVAILLDTPFLDEQHFEKLSDFSGPDFGVTEYRVITTTRLPIAIRRIRMSKGGVEDLVADVLSQLEDDGSIKKH